MNRFVVPVPVPFVMPVVVVVTALCRHRPNPIVPDMFVRLVLVGTEGRMVGGLAGFVADGMFVPGLVGGDCLVPDNLLVVVDYFVRLLVLVAVEHFWKRITIIK